VTPRCPFAVPLALADSVGARIIDNAAGRYVFETTVKGHHTMFEIFAVFGLLALAAIACLGFGLDGGNQFSTKEVAQAVNPDYS